MGLFTGAAMIFRADQTILGATFLALITFIFEIIVISFTDVTKNACLVLVGLIGEIVIIFKAQFTNAVKIHSYGLGTAFNLAAAQAKDFCSDYVGRTFSIPKGHNISSFQGKQPWFVVVV